MTEVPSQREGIVVSYRLRATSVSAMSAVVVMTMRCMRPPGMAPLPLKPCVVMIPCPKSPAMIVEGLLASLSQYAVPTAVVAALDPVARSIELAGERVFAGDRCEQGQCVEVPVDDRAATIEPPVRASRIAQRVARRVAAARSCFATSTVMPAVSVSCLGGARDSDGADQQCAQSDEPHHGPFRRMHRVSSMRCSDCSVRVRGDRMKAEAFPP